MHESDKFKFQFQNWKLPQNQIKLSNLSFPNFSFACFSPIFCCVIFQPAINYPQIKTPDTCFQAQRVKVTNEHIG